MPQRPSRVPALLPANYAPLLAAIKARVQTARIQAGLAANRELLRLYWDIGRMIVATQRTKGHGRRVVEQLAVDLQRSFPGMTGFSPLNVWRMRAFYATHAGAPSILSQAVTEFPRAPKLSQAVTELAAPEAGGPPEPFASLPWGHNLLLLHRLRDTAERRWYAARAVEHGWSRNVLDLQIDAKLHRRQGRAVTNFAVTLPPPQSDLAQSLIKDPYVFDFLALREDANERAIEEALLAHVEKFLLELGVGFALVGRQVKMRIAGRDHSLDLLFYHLRLRCYLVVDLKSKEFTPESAGKMNFYLSAVDERFRQPGDGRSIGLILVRRKERLIVEYALRDISKPIGVSDYVIKLVDSLPRALQGAVPSVAQLKAGLRSRLPRRRAPRRSKVARRIRKRKR